ncbi:protein kinase [bacterium]|nr:protein kinase [bacterium]
MASGTLDPELVPGLCAEGFAVRVCRPDPANLNPALIRPPVLLILDLGTDHERILDFAERVRNGLGDRAPEAIALAEGGEEIFERAFARGARDVLAKPVASAVLRVKSALHARASSSLPGNLGGYRILRLLGRGGMGTVYFAEKDGLQVALKVLDLGTEPADPEALARFRRETDILRSIHAPGIPAFLEAGRVDECFFLAMEYVPGETLYIALHRKALTEAEGARVITDVAGALEAIHKTGLIHRDVKPANVILSPGGGSKLVDFGLAKLAIDFGLTRSDEVVGTIQYMAPEVVLGENATPATDAFALGMTALEALAGKSPLLSGTTDEMAEQLADGKVPRVSDVAPKLGGAVRRVVDGLLEPKPKKRMTLAEARAALAG